jgi:Lectin C-type domain
MTSEWILAKMICQNYGMNLAAFKSIEEQNAVVNLTPNVFIDWTHVDGIGTEFKNKEEWYHSNGNKIPYSLNWDHNQPENYIGNELCMVVKRKDNTLLYNDCSCTSNIARIFLCEHELPIKSY